VANARRPSAASVEASIWFAWPAARVPGPPSSGRGLPGRSGDANEEAPADDRLQLVIQVIRAGDGHRAIDRVAPAAKGLPVDRGEIAGQRPVFDDVEHGRLRRRINCVNVEGARIRPTLL
jgi:hypothetical protein